MMYPYLYVRKRTLLAVAGCVWLMAGLNVARLGIIAYSHIAPVTFVQLLLSVVVFFLFGMMFYAISIRHYKRIKGFKQEIKPVWHFFDLKSYLIMAVMMGGGIWLRSGGLLPEGVVAVFYTGLGCALAAAGIQFWVLFRKYKAEQARNMIS